MTASSGGRPRAADATPIAVLLPSYGREKELVRALRKTPIRENDKFIVVANYPDAVLERLTREFGSRAHFIDERNFGRLGGAKAYNLAFEEAVSRGYEYTIHYADDVLPDGKAWVTTALELLTTGAADIGVFSSDEGHFGSYGWNFIKGVPIAHFFIARTDALSEYFDPAYRQYIVDLEISARLIRRGGRIALLPIRMRHYRSPLAREETGGNYEYDLGVFLRDYPEYTGALGSGRERMLAHRSGLTVVEEDTPIRDLVPWPPHRSSLALKIRSRIRGGS